MHKKVLLCLGLISFMCISPGLVHETNAGSSKTDVKYNSIDFRTNWLWIRSMSTQYLYQLSPDMIYVGPNNNGFAYHEDTTASQNTTSEIMIDLKWRLDGDWFMGIYSELGRRNEGHENNDYMNTHNLMDTDIGIMFIHKF